MDMALIKSLEVAQGETPKIGTIGGAELSLVLVQRFV
jgi:hypothetical protein